ncbi:MAG: hypothetical protein ACRDKW_11380, partial [Actinomycetota bacterium]
DSDRRLTTEVLRAAAAHKGAAFVEIYQNCPVFNDGAFDLLTTKGGRSAYQVRLVHGEKILFGEHRDKGVVFEDGAARIVDVDDVGIDRIAVHDATHPEAGPAFALSRLAHGPVSATPVGVFRSVSRPTYDEEMSRQLAAAQETHGPGDLDALLTSGDTWEVPDQRSSEEGFAGEERRGRGPTRPA